MDAKLAAILFIALLQSVTSLPFELQERSTSEQNAVDSEFPSDRTVRSPNQDVNQDFYSDTANPRENWRTRSERSPNGSKERVRYQHPFSRTKRAFRAGIGANAGLGAHMTIGKTEPEVKEKGVGKIENAFSANNVDEIPSGQYVWYPGGRPRGNVGRGTFVGGRHQAFSPEVPYQGFYPGVVDGGFYGEVPNQGFHGGGQIPLYGTENSGGPIPLYGRENSGGQIPLYGRENSGGQIPLYGSHYSGGQIPFYGKHYSGGQIPLYGRHYSG